MDKFGISLTYHKEENTSPQGFPFFYQKYLIILQEEFRDMAVSFPLSGHNNQEITLLFRVYEELPSIHQ